MEGRKEGRRKGVRREGGKDGWREGGREKYSSVIVRICLIVGKMEHLTECVCVSEFSATSWEL